MHICPHAFSTQLLVSYAMKERGVSALFTDLHNRYPQERQRLMENFTIAL